MRDGKTVIASDTLHRIRSYDFDTQQDMTLITENSPVTYFAVDKPEEHILVTTKNEGLRLWDIKTRVLIRTFFGSVHNEYVISSTFGGVGGDFIASGSEGSFSHSPHSRFVSRRNNCHLESKIRETCSPNTWTCRQC